MLTISSERIACHILAANFHAIATRWPAGRGPKISTSGRAISIIDNRQGGIPGSELDPITIRIM